MTRSKKIAAGLLVSITIIPLLLLLFFLGRQKFIRWEMEEKLEHEQLTSITMNESEFRWYKKDKEIIYNGHFFDVKTISKIDGGKLLITGLYDYQEQKLHVQLDNWMNKKTSSNTNHQVFFKWISQLYDHQITQTEFASFHKLSSEQRLRNVRALSLVFLSVQTPPPRLTV